MALCEQCGSISIVRAQRSPTDKLVRLVTGKRPFVCRRCGWRGRRDWTDKDLRQLMDYGAGGAEPDPSLVVLDEEPVVTVPAKGRRKKAKAPRPAIERRTPEDLDLAALELPYAETLAPGSDDRERLRGQSTSANRQRTRDRRRRSRQREMIATVAVAALVVSLMVMLGLTGSCGGGTAAL